jgi:hypothetical protein
MKRRPGELAEERRTIDRMMMWGWDAIGDHRFWHRHVKGGCRASQSRAFTRTKAARRQRYAVRRALANGCEIMPVNHQYIP